MSTDVYYMPCACCAVDPEGNVLHDHDRCEHIQCPRWAMEAS